MIKQFFLDNAVLFGSLGGFTSVFLIVWGAVKYPFLRKQKPTHIAAVSIKDMAEASAPKVDEPHVMEFLRIRKAMKADLEEEFKEAAEKDKAPLLTRIAELERQIANPDDALKEAQKRIADLEALLDREGNDIGAERIEAAKTAMEAGDYSLADGIFAEIEAREELAVQRSARAAFGRGEVAEAEIRWQDAATHYARAAQLEPRFDTLKKAREFAWRAGDYAAALRHGEDMLKLADQGALTEEQKAEAYNDHALTLKAQGQYPAAEKLYRDALDIAARTIGTAHPDYAIGLNNLAAVLETQGQNAEAEKLYREALAITAKTVGAAHPSYAIRLNNLAGVLGVQGRYAEAEKLFREALAIGAKTIGTAHPNYATRLNNLAGVLEAQGQYTKAETLYREALAITAKTIGAAHPDYATHLNNLAVVLEAQGQYAEAETHCRQASDILEARLGAEHPHTLQVRENLEDLLANSKR